MPAKQQDKLLALYRDLNALRKTAEAQAATVAHLTEMSETLAEENAKLKAGKPSQKHSDTITALRAEVTHLESQIEAQSAPKVEGKQENSNKRASADRAAKQQGRKQLEQSWKNRCIEVERDKKQLRDKLNILRRELRELQKTERDGRTAGRTPPTTGQRESSVDLAGGSDSEYSPSESSEEEPDVGPSGDSDSLKDDSGSDAEPAVETAHRETRSRARERKAQEAEVEELRHK